MAAIKDLLGSARQMVFVPFALGDHDAYTARVRERFALEGIDVRGLDPRPSGAKDLEEAQSVFVGGGNTFRLLDRLERSGHLETLRGRVRGGIPYLGSSAGSVIAAPTLMTTNDMPIVQPRTFMALGLVPFQINAHYFDPDPTSRHMGETRELRIQEFLEENETPVVGLREGAWIRVHEGRTTLGGSSGARVFVRGKDPVEILNGARIDRLLE